MLTDTVKKNIVEKILEITSPVKVIVFGSYAYGTPKPGSDLDIAVVVNKVVSKISESNRIWQALREIHVSKDILVTTQEEYDFYSKEPGSIFRTIAEKGIVLYGR